MTSVLYDLEIRESEGNWEGDKFHRLVLCVEVHITQRYGDTVFVSKLNVLIVCVS